ncbi:MAG: hypothetical protein B6I38_06680 [Anaerolineaceae bacterium 4572_5.1]|nr:MAG: hypothetical protein B6I38_06680 [Anaerolineaceae bacterium 4572_5.1]
MDLTDQNIKKELELKTQGILVDDLVAEAGRKILSLQFARMIGHEPGTRLGADAEELHDMRVATRRMRVAFEVFEPFFKKKAIKPYIKGLRGAARALGGVRDLDVFLDELNDYLASVPENERPEYKILLSQWREEHNKARLKMLRFLDSDRYQIFTQQFVQFLNTPDEGSRRLETVQPNQVREFAPKIIYERLAAVQSHERVLGNAAIKELHTLRIRLKKLRYTVEFFGDVLTSESKEIIRSIKILQDHLGKLNDADAACQMVNEFIAASEKEQSTLPVHERANPEPMFMYLAKKENERQRLLATFPQLWQTIMGKEFSEKLAEAISALQTA